MSHKMRRHFTGLSLLMCWLCCLSGAAFAQPWETVAELPSDVPPGNIAITPDGRIFLSMHQFYGHPFRAVELHKDGSVTPFPNSDWAQATRPDGVGLNSVLGIQADRRGRVWLLDNPGEGHSAKLIAWDTKHNRLDKLIYLPQPLVPANTFVNDLAVDLTHNALYISDPAGGSNAALVVVDLTTGRVRRLLEGTRFVTPEALDMVIDGRAMTLGDHPARIGINPITLDAADTWVYFGAMTGTRLYRARTSDLLDETLSAEALAARVEDYGSKPISDGITVDRAGQVYITSITDASVGVVRADGRYDTLFADAALAWPDGFAVGPDNWIYATINELHRSPVLNGGNNGAKGLFKVIRFKALAEALPGR